jgi:hypothetical protein
MKKAVKLAALIMAGLMMVSVCSCGNKQDNSGGNTGKVTVEEDESGSSESSEDTKAKSSGNLGQLIELSHDALGKDAETAEKMIGEFFGVELEDRLNGVMTNTRNDVVTVMRVYIQLLQKDDLRFNGMEMWVDQNDGHVRRIEYSLSLDSYNSVPIDDTPEFREEIKNLYKSSKDELENAYGEAFLADKVEWDEDSFCCAFNTPGNLYAYTEIRDFTEPGGNGLLKTTMVFADEKFLLD